MIKNLKKLRNENKISQQQLADVIHVSQQSVNKYENHDVEPDIETLIKIADYFNVSVDYLIGRTEILQMADRLHMSDLTDSEVELINKFKNFNIKQQYLIIQLFDSFI